MQGLPIFGEYQTMSALEDLELTAIRDAYLAVYLSLRSSWRRLLVSWLYTPVGIFLILLACWGVDSAIRLSGVSFPPSVACMILLFFGLIGCDAIFDEKKTRKVVRVIDVPAGFSLRYINVFFTPSFILLPLSPAIGAVEIGKIIAIFLIGFVSMLTATSYLVRALQIFLKTSKHSPEETFSESLQESIPLANIPEPSQEPSLADTPQDSLLSAPYDEDLERPDLESPQPAAETVRVRGPGPEVAFVSQAPERLSLLQQEGTILSRSQRWAAFLTIHLDTATYILFFLIGIPITYTTSYTMPLQLPLNVLAYTVALSFPPKVRRILHPVLGCSILSVLSFYILSLTLQQTFLEGLRQYSTNTRYLSLFRGQTKSLPLPGAGDIFASVLDVSIVALALPMYSYRRELKRHLPIIAIPGITLAVGSLFAYPAICYSLGIESRRSLSFAARSLTLALAIPSINNLDGDLNLAAVLCITSGIIGVLIGGPILKFLRIPKDDYVTRGVSLGMNSAAITTAHLLTIDPRAAALSSLTMVLFGTSMVVLTAVPAVVQILSKIVGGLA